MNRALHIVAANLTNDARVKSYVEMMKSAGWSVDVICYQEDGLPDTEVCNGTTVFRVSPKYQGNSIIAYLVYYIMYYIKAGIVAKKLHKEHCYRIVHVHNMPNAIIGLAHSLCPKPHIILDMHDIISVNYASKFGNSSIASGLLRAEERWSISKADCVFCADIGQKKILEQLHPNTNTIVMMNHPNPELFQWEDHSWNGGVFRYVYHGTVTHRLGVDRVITALKTLRKDVVFRLIGDGDDMRHVINLVKQNNLGDRVEIYPTVPVEKLPELLRDCHAGVIPSRKTEATDRAMLPVKLLEYSALGIPSVVSKLHNIEEHYTSEQVFYFDPLSDSDLADRMHQFSISDSVRNGVTQELRLMNVNNHWHYTAKAYIDVVVGIHKAVHNSSK